MTAIKRLHLACWLLSLALLACGGKLSADDEYQKIIYWRMGDPAPAFDLKDDQGAVWKSSQHYGKKYVVVYFYLGDFMKNCTKQACAYSDDYGRITAQGAEVVGVSGDATTNHKRFKDKYHLQQTLLSDDKGEVGKAFGLAWSGGGKWTITDDTGKEITLARGITESRWTWIIGKDGRVLYKNMTPNPDEDSKQVVKFLTELNEKEARRP
jgi:thioredoxin-dependent peroxiredoxin